MRKLFHLMEVPVLLAYSVTRYFWNEKVAILALTALFLILMEYDNLKISGRITEKKNNKHLKILLNGYIVVGHKIPQCIFITMLIMKLQLVVN